MTHFQLLATLVCAASLWLFIAAGVTFLLYHYLTFPIVRVAVVVGLIGMGLFGISEQYAEMKERRR